MTDVNVMFKADVIAFVILWQMLCHVFWQMLLPLMWKMLDHICFKNIATTVMADVIGWWQMELPLKGDLWQMLLPWVIFYFNLSSEVLSRTSSQM